jgi:hypothetical protein
MPNKFNAERRHHVPKMKSTVTNWSEYETGLAAWFNSAHVAA